MTVEIYGSKHNFSRKLVSQESCVNRTRKCSWNQSILSNKCKSPCSMKQWEPLTGVDLTTDPATMLYVHCWDQEDIFSSKLVLNVGYQLAH